MRRASPAKTRVGRQPAAHSDRQRRDRLGQSAVLLLGPASVAMLTAMLLLWPNRVHSYVGRREPGIRSKPENWNYALTTSITSDASIAWNTSIASDTAITWNDPTYIEREVRSVSCIKF